MAAQAEFPHVMLWRQEEITDHSVPSSALFSRLLLKLEGLQNDFFLYRLLLQKGELDEGNLLVTSYELVSLVLNLWTHMDRFPEILPDFSWLVSSALTAGRDRVCHFINICCSSWGMALHPVAFFASVC